MIPFSGTAGWCLNTALSWAGLSREECFIGNVCQWRPGASSNEFDALDWEGEEVQGGIAQLLADLTVFRPNVVVCLGNVPLHLFRNGNVAPPRAGAKGEKKGAIKWPSKVSSWRGSLFASSPSLYSISVAAAGVVATAEANFPSLPPSSLAAPYSTTPPRAGETLPPTAPSLLVGDEGGVVEKSAPMPGAREGAPLASAGLPPFAFKCLSTWHPAFVLRSWSAMFDLRQDLTRARLEAGDPSLILPRVVLEWGPNPLLNA